MSAVFDKFPCNFDMLVSDVTHVQSTNLLLSRCLIKKIFFLTVSVCGCKVLRSIEIHFVLCLLSLHLLVLSVSFFTSWFFGGTFWIDYISLVCFDRPVVIIIIFFLQI